MTSPLPQAPPGPPPPPRALPPLDARVAEIAREPGRTWGPLDALVAVLVVPLTLVVTALLTLPFDPSPATALALSSLVLAGLAVLAVRRAVRQSGGVRAALGLDPPRWSDVGLVALFTVAVGLVQGVVTVLLWLLVPELRGVVPDNTSHLRDEPLPVLVVVAVTAVVVAPVVEEVLFRGLVLRGLMLRTGFWPAALVSSAAFGLLHVPVLGLRAVPTVVATGLIGLGLCVLVRHSGRLGPAVLAHAVRNAIGVGALVAAAL